MALSKACPEGVGFVAATAFGSCVVNQFLVYRVMAARKEFKVEYPALYSADNEKFNCIQRAHQNYLEMWTPFLISLVLAGRCYPKPAAAAGTLYLLGRIAYGIGYGTGDPKKRMWGAFGYPGLIFLYGAAGWSVKNMICGSKCC